MTAMKLHYQGELLGNREIQQTCRRVTPNCPGWPTDRGQPPCGVLQHIQISCSIIQVNVLEGDLLPRLKKRQVGS